jgi:ADP-ribose pyrophosphatase
LGNEKTLTRKNIFNGKIIKLDVHEVLLENQKTAEREIITHQGGVGVIPITNAGEIVFVKQFRKPFECETLEIPAGKKEKSEEPLSCAERELKEETGITAGRITFLVDMYPSPGYTDEIVYIYKAEDLTYGDMSTDEDEFIEVYKYSIEEAVEMIKSGKIKDAKTIVAVMMVANEMLIQNHGQIRK